MRIVFIRPCCIGDVVMATAALTALRNAYPHAHITWAVGGWSRRAIEYHPAVDTILDSGHAALPVKSVGGFLRFVRQLRSGHFDMAVALVRSPLMSAAVWLADIPQRAGIDSNGRGFGYNIRAAINPDEARHEAQIYLDVVRAMGIATDGFQINLPILPDAQSQVAALLNEHGVQFPYLVINPTGGGNPGMMMDSKRWPVNYLAHVADTLADECGATLVLIGGPADGQLLDNLRTRLKHPATIFKGALSFPEIGALAAASKLYIGNDTGLTHLAAASGAKTVMILGPSDPIRYAPYTPYTMNSLALWKPVDLASGGVAMSKNATWDWVRDGIHPDEALMQMRDFLKLENFREES